MKKKRHIVVIDPAVKRPELESLNQLIHLSPLPVTYHLPALHGLASLKREDGGIAGLILFGSASSVNEKLDWQLALQDWLGPRIDKGIPTFGICFGHQFLAHHFGGKIGYLFPDQKKLVGYREIQLEPDRLWGNKRVRGRVCVSHNECVIELPKELKAIGRSPEVVVDALTHKKLPLWGFQSHPEATDSFLTSRGFKKGPWQSKEGFGQRILKSFVNFARK